MSREKKFTPGQWTPHHHLTDCVTFIGPEGEENLFIKNSDGYFACQNEHDANLIAAAPGLLEALEGMCDIWKTVCDCNGHDPNHMSQFGRAIGVIAKAYGETS